MYSKIILLNSKLIINREKEEKYSDTFYVERLSKMLFDDFFNS